MEQTTDSTSPSTTLKAILGSAFRYRLRFIRTFALVMGLVVLYVLFVPREYRSEMNILVRNARPDYQITPEKTNGSIPQSDVTEERINSEIEVLRSRDVADKVIDPSWNSSSATNHTPVQIKDHEKAVTKLSKHLSVELLRKTNVIHVSYDTRSPQAATATVEKLLNTFLLKQQEIERSSGTSAFFATEQERYKRELDEAELQLAKFQQSTQIVSLPDKESALEQQIVDLQQQMRTTDVQISELSNRIRSGQDQLQTLKPRQITSQKSVPNILAMEQLGTMLAGYKNQRTTLMTKFLPTDRLVQEVDQQIANTTEALRAATEVNSSENSTDVNPVWQQVNNAVTQNSTDVNAAKARRSNLGNQLAKLQATLVAAEGSTVDFNTLQTRVTELKGNYQLYTQKRNEAQIANAMDKEQLVNVAIAERPTFSAIPATPKVGLTLAMGSFAALFFAACAVFFAEMSRDTLASAAELELVSAVPVLATVPLIYSSVQNSSSPAIPGNFGYTRSKPSVETIPERAINRRSGRKERRLDLPAFMRGAQHVADTTSATDSTFNLVPEGIHE